MSVFDNKRILSEQGGSDIYLRPSVAWERAWKLCPNEFGSISKYSDRATPHSRYYTFVRQLPSVAALEYEAKILRLSIDWRDKEKIGIAYYLNFRYNINKSGHIR